MTFYTHANLCTRYPQQTSSRPVLRINSQCVSRLRFLLPVFVWSMHGSISVWYAALLFSFFSDDKIDCYSKSRSVYVQCLHRVHTLWYSNVMTVLSRMLQGRQTDAITTWWMFSKSVCVGHNTSNIYMFSFISQLNYHKSLYLIIDVLPCVIWIRQFQGKLPTDMAGQSDSKCCLLDKARVDLVCIINCSGID